MEYKHFGHQHTLTLYKIPAGQQYQCHGCHLPCHDSIFACWSCSFFLHEHCGNANRYVKHPSHPEHPLVLLPTPTYCSSSYLCNGCGSPGSSFSYCCPPMCEVDVHLHCAYLPPKVTHKAHEHDLFLSFKLPDFGGSAVHCKICAKELNPKHWYYFCEKPECGFRIHTFCATNEVKPGLYGDNGPEDQVQVQVPVCSQPQPTAEDLLAEMFQIQMQLQMAQQINQIMNSAKI